MDTTKFEFQGNDVEKVRMAKLMKNHFEFAGVPTPVRKAQSKALIAESRDLPLAELLAEIKVLYQREEREYHYLAIDFATANARRMYFPEVKELTQMVLEKPWWDTTDAWRIFFANYIDHYPREKEPLFNLFYGHESIWMRRVAITLQLAERETLDTFLLTKAIFFDRRSSEPFIQKAIGWALRQYSKYDLAWVKNFVENYDLKPVVIREASKHF